ncbi:MAG: archaeosortase A [Methanomicrobiales archaeon]|nr:archaeosortase A [Methanomicrobiales archaeon]
MVDVLELASTLLLLGSFLAFLGFLLVSSQRKVLGIAGWIGMVAFLYSQLPHLIAVENNFMYPLFAVLAIPFLIVTIRRLRTMDKAVMQLTTAAAAAFVIYAPFQYIPFLGNLLITLLVQEILWALTLLQHSATLLDWNLIGRNDLRIEIILACTGIQSIAIMLGVVGGVQTTTRQKVLAFLLIVPTIYILNIFRNAFVIIAYTEQWFPYLPQIAGNGEYGYESFFWAHNVLSEIGALLFLIAIAYALFTAIPQLGAWAEGLVTMYTEEFKGMIGKKP